MSACVDDGPVSLNCEAHPDRRNVERLHGLAAQLHQMYSLRMRGQVSNIAVVL